ncbi:hypothetical protein H9Q69_006874 [Fusarium xylarioides]|nr:hypothetical protein H9Q69_006874 [Fusarium xylarioides]
MESSDQNCQATSPRPNFSFGTIFTHGFPSSGTSPSNEQLGLFHFSVIIIIIICYFGSAFFTRAKPTNTITIVGNYNRVDNR